MNNYKENAEIVRVIFETDGWDVKMQDSGEAVWFTGAVGGFQGVCKAFPFRVLVDDKFAHVYGIFPESMRDNLPSAAEFITRVNYGNRFGAFEMNYDTGEVRFHVMLMMSAVLANNDVVPATIGLVVTTLDRYSRGLFMILLGIRDAGEIFKDFEVK